MNLDGLGSILAVVYEAAARAVYPRIHKCTVVHRDHRLPRRGVRINRGTPLLSRGRNLELQRIKVHYEQIEVHRSSLPIITSSHADKLSSAPLRPQAPTALQLVVHSCEICSSTC